MSIYSGRQDQAFPVFPDPNLNWFPEEYRGHHVYKFGTPISTSAWSRPTIAYEISIDGRRNDLLRIHGQAELTNPFTMQSVTGRIRLLSNGTSLSEGTRSWQDCVYSTNPQLDPPYGAHHMPLWADGVLRVTKDGPVVITLEVSADRRGGHGIMVVEPEYGHIIVEHYRRYETVDDARAAGARVLQYVQTGAKAGDNGRLYSVTVPLALADVVRLFGQSTSQPTPNDSKLHSQSIYSAREQISPISSENIFPAVGKLPLWTEARFISSSSSSQTFALEIGGIDAENVFHEGCGLLAMVFSSNPSAAGANQFLTASHFDPSTTDVTITAKEGEVYVPVVTQQIEAAVGDHLRIVGVAQFKYPSNYPPKNAIACYVKVEAIRNGQVVGSSTKTYKNSTKDTVNLPLRALAIMKVADEGEYTIRLSVACTRHGTRPQVECTADGTALIIDHWSSGS